MDAPLWTPSADAVDRSAMAGFVRRAAERARTPIADSVALHQWSITEPEAFWSLLWDEVGVIGDRAPASTAPGQDFYDARFYPGARLNFAENLLRGDADRRAVVFVREDGLERVLSLGELRDQVARFVAVLEEVGVGAGDRVAAWMPNLPETLVAMLAATAVGAVFTSTSADFGTAGVVDRFGQVEPLVLIAADGYTYAGKRHDCLGRLAEIVGALPTLRRVVVVGNLADHPALGSLPLARSYTDDVIGRDPSATRFSRFDFEHPGFVLYSSGTTGAPKGIVHRAAGVLVKHLYEQKLHCDVRPGDVVLYFTTCGWMMWNWLMSALACEATIVLFDGAPTHPRSDTLFEVAARHGVTLFGTSAKFIDSCRKAGLRPSGAHDLRSIRSVCSTGSPLSPEGFAYVYDHIGADVHLASISGGTDLCGCFVGGDPTRPVWPGEIQGPMLGMAVDVFDDAGEHVALGRGELVCTKPFPSMPLGFWNDPDGSRYRSTYGSRFAGVWAQGDFASWTEHGGMVIHGRSDATLNSGGVRIGTAEIYGQVDQFPEIVESLAIAQDWDADTRVVLFVRLADGATLDDDLQTRVRAVLRAQCSPRHVPAVIVSVPDIPRTRNGKLVELAVGDVVNGRPVRNREALANPEALDAFADLPELRR